MKERKGELAKLKIKKIKIKYSLKVRKGKKKQCLREWEKSFEKRE